MKDFKYGLTRIKKVYEICGKYFIPTSRQDEIYCDFTDDDGKSCREKGAGLTYKKNLENVPALLEYRKSYQKKINKFKKGKLSEEKLYEWMMENK